MRNQIQVLLAALALSAAVTVSASAIRSNISSNSIVAQAATMVPTANPLPSRTPTLPPTNTNTPTLTPLPSETLMPTATLAPSETASPFVFVTNTLPIPSMTFTFAPTQPSINSPTPGAATDGSGTPVPTWTPPARDAAVEIADHYHFHRPIGDDGINYGDRTYPYGGTAGGTMQVHHGLDFENPSQTPILAAGDGVVYYAGNDMTDLFGPTPNYYGNLVVIQHGFSSPEGQPVFTLYGHMVKTNVTTGQSVKTGQIIGFVGSTGVAVGAHVHFEVRLGDPQNFDDTRNPDLWIYPYQGYGTLAGRVTDSAGNLLYQATVQIRPITSQNTRYAFTYPDNTVHGDDTFHENFTRGDLIANYYEVSVNDGQRIRFRQIIYVYPNRTTWINIVLN